jgi:competence protein ComEC
MFKGSTISIGDIHIDVLHPSRGNPGIRGVHNNQSLVLQIGTGRESFLLTGDIEREIETKITNSRLSVDSAILKSPHHGSISSSTMEFLQRVSPEIVVISVGRGNWYGLPHPDVLERYRRIGAKVYRTDLHGAIEITASKKGISVRTAACYKDP